MKAAHFLLLFTCVIQACSSAVKEDKTAADSAAPVTGVQAELAAFRKYERSNLFREPEFVVNGVTRTVKLHHYAVPGSSFLITGRVYRAIDIDSLQTREFVTMISFTDSLGTASDTAIINRGLINSRLKPREQLLDYGVLGMPGPVTADEQGIEIPYRFWVPLTDISKDVKVKVSWEGKILDVY